MLKKLTINEIITPQFHILQKIHEANIPGRPFVSSVECHASKISKFVDHYLKPQAEALPSYIKNTADFINKINDGENITGEIFLVTLDVKFLHTNNPNYKGIEAQKKP